MTIISAVPGAGDAFAMLVAGLRTELGCADVEAIAARIFECERLDFLWSGRVAEHYLGQHFADDLDAEDGCNELSRLAFLSFLNGRWYAGVALVDGDGEAVELLWSRSFQRHEDAADAYQRAR